MSTKTHFEQQTVLRNGDLWDNEEWAKYPYQPSIAELKSRRFAGNRERGVAKQKKKSDKRKESTNERVCPAGFERVDG